MTIEVKRRAMQTLEKAYHWYDSWKMAFVVVAECLGVRESTVRTWYAKHRRGEL